jgi:hypothetical protein
MGGSREVIMFRTVLVSALLTAMACSAKIEAPMLLPGITITTRPDNYAAFYQMQMARFDGTSWLPEDQ